MRKIKSISISILLITFFSIELSGAQGSKTPSIEELKSRNFMVTTLQGKRVKLNDLIGKGKPVLIDLWATWCGPCRIEIPHLIEIAERHRKDGLIVLGLTMEDPVEDRKVVVDFVRELRMNYQVAFAPTTLYTFYNPGSTTMRIPQTMIFGPDGVLVKKLIGYNPRIGKEILDKAVAGALGPPSAGSAR